VSGGDVTRTTTMRATDNAAGIADLYMSYTSPISASVDWVIFIRSSDLVSGNELNGTWQHTVTYARGMEVGIYTFNDGYLFDRGGQMTHITPALVVTLGLPTTFNVTGPIDMLPPNMTAFQLTPVQFPSQILQDNVTDVVVTVTLHLMDDVSVQQATVYFAPLVSPFPRQWSQTMIFRAENRISGTATDGWYARNFTVLRGTPSMFVGLSDNTVIGDGHAVLVFDHASHVQQWTVSGVVAAGWPTQFAVECGSTPPTPPPNNGGNRLSSGAIAGIVIGSVAGVLIAGYLIRHYCCRKEPEHALLLGNA